VHSDSRTGLYNQKLAKHTSAFDEVPGISPFDATPKVTAWRSALAQRRSVIEAAVDGYRTLLRNFVIERGGVLGKLLVVQTGSAVGMH
jgi:hypothetical protein